VLRYESGFEILALALAGSVGAAVLGALGAVRRVISLAPAEAMRPEAPAGFRAGALEHGSLARRLKPETRMMIRNIVRRPARFAFSVLAIALALTILVLGRYFLDMVDEVLDVEFGSVERQDATLAFTNPRSARAAFELMRLPGVARSEPLRAVPVRLRAGVRTKRTVVFGLEPQAELRRVVDRRRRVVELPPEGIVLPNRLAEVLGVRPGQRVEMEVLEGERPVRDVVVAATSDELLGVAAYMRREPLARLLREGPLLSGAFLKVDRGTEERLYSRLKSLPAVGGVSLQRVMVRSFEETIARLLGTVTSVLVILASVIAVAIVYNGARIALSERGRELASLRVLGFTKREVTKMLLAEQGMMITFAIPLGWAIGYAACAVLSGLYDTDLMRMPLVAVPKSYLFAALVVLAATALSSLVVNRRIGRMDLVEVLKTRE
jgi:putative ABC transport system permease protein